LSPSTRKLTLGARLDLLRLDDLLDDRVRIAVREIRDCDDGLFPEERAAMTRAVPARRAEFSTGRVLARELLTALGFDPAPLAPDPDRTPQWPEGVVGSIAHADGVCVVAAARANKIAGVGIDVESEEPLEYESFKVVCTPIERTRIERFRSGGGTFAKMIYCAKEAAYKCWYPIARAPLEFQDVTTEVDFKRGNFAATVRRGAAAGVDAPRHFIGRVFVRDRWIFAGTLVTVEALKDPSGEF